MIISISLVMSKKNIMLVMRKAPHGTIYAYEGLEVALIAASYNHNISMAFIDDGVYSLKKNQQTKYIGIKSFVETYQVVKDYAIEEIYIDKESLQERGLTKEDLININYYLKNEKEIALLMDEQDILLPF